MTFRVSHPENHSTSVVQAQGFAPASEHYPVSDQPLFTAAYDELCWIDLNGRRVLEVCCGEGMFAMCLASAFPSAEIVGMDKYQGNGVHIKKAIARLPNLSFV
jgi:tRNA G46 methylase TrmB